MEGQRNRENEHVEDTSRDVHAESFAIEATGKPDSGGRASEQPPPLNGESGGMPIRELVRKVHCNSPFFEYAHIH